MLTADSKKRLVRDAHELLNLVLESLERLQERLTGYNGIVRVLWNEGADWRPKDENVFSDVVRDHLQRDLDGIAAQREVQVRRPNPKAPVGERGDLLVTATSTDHTDGFGVATVVIESKGCWNRCLQTAMADQLKRRYLIDEGHRCGLYLVGWFRCERWDDPAVPDWTLEDARAELAAQAADLCEGGYEIRAFVIDARPPSTKG